MVTTEKATPLKQPYYQYPSYLVVATRMLFNRAEAPEFNFDWVHPNLVCQLKEVDSLLSNYGGLTDETAIAVLVQPWLIYKDVYCESNASKN